MKSVGDILAGNRSNLGQRHVTSTGVSLTKGPTSDPLIPGGSYLSVGRPDGAKKTVVFDHTGRIAKSQPNSRW